MTATTEAPAANGTKPTAPEDIFPLDSFRDAARHLRRPFTEHAVKFKVQATWPKENPTSGLIVAYIDARLVVERLNLLVPHLWHDGYRPVGGQQMWCDLTIDGITRSDVGEGTGKGLVSDALKRAAVKFGIGVSLYAIPKMILELTDGTLKSKQTRESLTLELLPKGEQVLRGMYAHWLDERGLQAFGEPLDHGDVADAQGDHEAEPPAPDGVDPQTGEVKAPEPEREPITLDQAAELLDAAKAANVTYARLRLAASHVLGDDVGEFSTDAGAVAALGSLNAEQAVKLGEWIAKKATEVAA